MVRIADEVTSGNSMPLMSNEIKARAYKFSQDWKDAHRENGDTHSFYNDFFHVFGIARRSVANYEKAIKKLNNKTGFIDLFWPGVLLIEQKSAGRDLSKALEQANDYCIDLKEREKPRFILVSDFQNFELYDLDENTEIHFKLADLKDYIQHFYFIAGIKPVSYKDQDPANIIASNLMTRLHDLLFESGYIGKDLEKLLVRIMFCLFAEDTDIFNRGTFTQFIENKTLEDGSNVGCSLVHLFDILNTFPKNRQKSIDEDMMAFPYVNGSLFADFMRIPAFNTAMRQALLDCCYFDWTKISPALFGSLFQTAMLSKEQREQGAHYTSEYNILKTIHPLFLDDLYAEFHKIKNSKSTKRQSQLEAFHTKISELTFFDPACGCGNFLILAFREMRELEIQVLNEIYPTEIRQDVLDVGILTKVTVSQFYGIEIAEFPAKIAETALWIVDHQMNMKLSETFGKAFVRLPLPAESAHIFHGNALITNWSDVLPSNQCNYILGNPPFVGKAFMSDIQKEALTTIAKDIKGKGNLDFVTAWFIKAARYIQKTKIKVGFVSTNSITQGEQALILWKELLNKHKIHIHFAYQTFKWTLDEKKGENMEIAKVHVIIVGFANYDTDSKYLFKHDIENNIPVKNAVQKINFYLLESDNIFIESRSKPLCDVPEITFGNMPIGKDFLFDDFQKQELIKADAQIAPFIKPFISAKEFINGETRWCLWLDGVAPDKFRHIKPIINIIKNIKKQRLESDRLETQKLGDTAYLFGYIKQPQSNYLVIPRVSSEHRKYIPMIFATPDYIVGDTCLAVDNATLYHFGILTSTMHMDWMRYTCGRLKSDYRYSNTIVYNNFPWCNPTDKQKQAIEQKAQKVLDARLLYSDSSLADLYDVNTMPPELHKAHNELDMAVDKAYKSSGFNTLDERIEFLFDMYQKLSMPLIPIEKIKKKRTKK